MAVWPLLFRSLPVALLVAVASSGCERSVTRPPGGDLLITQLQAQPSFVPGGVPFELAFRILGGEPSEVSYLVGGERFTCAPVGRSDGRLSCTHPGIDRSAFGEGPVDLRLEVGDGNGGVVFGETVVTLDDTCPRALTVSLEPRVAEPGDVAVLSFEASEVLRDPPRIARAGRSWGVPEGDGQRYRLEYPVTAADPSVRMPVRVDFVDRAGNRNTSCGQAVELDFAVDQRRPVIDPSRVLVVRGGPGVPTVLTATAGAFSDDVGIESLRVRSLDGAQLLATLQPLADGSLESTSLGLVTEGRVTLEAIDAFGRTSGARTVPESWRITLGTGSSPGVALRTAVRRTAAPPGTRAMRDRTVEGAPDVVRADARSLVVRAQVGFEKVGELPSFYEGINRAYAGYEPTTDTIIAAGGYSGNEYRFFAEYVDDVLGLRWDEREGIYRVERLTSLSNSDPLVPPPGYGVNLAFDGRGCGVLYGGDMLIEPTRAVNTSQLWQICARPGGYEWTQIPAPIEIGSARLARFSPITWDPRGQRYVAVGGSFDQEARVVFVEPGPTPSDWRVRLSGPLPTAFGSRFNSYLFYDPRFDGIAVGLGGVNPIGNGEQYLQWSFADGVWRASDAPLELGFYSRFGWAYEEAREQLVLWGGNTRSDFAPLSEVWYQAGTATTGPSAWRRAEVEFPVPRDYPSMVYDPDRQVVVMFGGTRIASSAQRTIPPDIHQLISQPAFPYAQLEVELGSARPEGIEALELVVRGAATGDADGVGPGTAQAGGGISVVLWDGIERAWVEVARDTRAAPGAFATTTLRLIERPERFINDDGRLAISLRSSAPATEARSARLELDLVDGAILLRAATR